MEQKKFCRKCLLQEVSEDEYLKSLKDYIDRIDPEIKTNPKEYERRLSLCKECDNLINGMCTKCGCFVELRAAVQNHYCPNLEKKW